MSKSKPRIILFDGNAVVHRAYHALPPLTTKKGELVNAVYGFSSILLKVLKELNPDYVAVAFDSPEPTFRHKEFLEYKAKRKATPEDLSPQFLQVKEVLSALNIPIFEVAGYEADDLVGTLANKVPSNLESIIVTGDLDELQLVDNHTKVYTMRRGFTDTILYDEKMIKDRFNLTPEQFVDYKALKGDPSDNIPGVPGIGEKTAAELISKFGSLEYLYKNLDRVGGKTKEVLEKNKDQAFISKKLVKIVTEVPIKFNLSACKTHDFDRQKVFELFRKLEFKSLLNKLPRTKKEEVKIPKKRPHIKTAGYKLIDNKRDFKNLLANLKKQEFLAVDTETDGWDIVENKLVGISFSFKEKEAYYIPVGHTIAHSSQLTAHSRGEKQLPLNYVLSGLKLILEDPKIKKIGHNIKFDHSLFKKYNIELSPIYFDTMIASYLLNPNIRAETLSNLAFSELGIEMIPITDFIGTGKDQITFNQVQTKDATIYSCEDADITFRLFNHLKPELLKENFWNLFSKIEIPLISVLSKMELAGVKVNKEFLKEMSVDLEKKVQNLETKIYKLARTKFNINSPQQLKEILFEKLKLAEKIDKKELKKVKSGGYSTAATELEKLRGIHPVVALIFNYRELVKLKTTYVDALPNLINKTSGRIHTSYNQAITTTGRLSSSDPNLQNIPIRTEVGREIRKAFVAGPEYKLLSADYSQIELRIIAHISKDKRMIEAFHSRVDIHTKTASEIYDVSVGKVTPEMRRAMKAVNFGVIYGMSPHGLAEATGMSREEAKVFIDKYYELHPGVARYVEEIKEVARSIGYVETLFGRKRPLPEINSANHIIRAAAERMAINMPIQGTAADLMKLAMIEIDKELSEISSDSKMLLQVHDELVFEVPKKDVKKVSKFVEEIMENIHKLDVPIKVEIGVGDNWGETK